MLNTLDNSASENELGEIFDDCENMNSCCLGNLIIITNTRGAIDMTKEEYPAKYGIYNEIRTKEFSFCFNPTGEIRYIRGLTQSWPHPWEWLKRTWGNDWVYYSVDLDRKLGRIIDLMGENYLPCLSYESNPIIERTPYSDPLIARAFSSWTQVYGTLVGASVDALPGDIKEFIENVIRTNDDDALIEKTDELHEIFGGRISVLPPDTRHVDYEVIPLNIADGCLYRCKFCSVKTGAHFKARSHENIEGQLEKLKAYYDNNIQNINSLFIGNHDALAAGGELISFAARKAYEAFGFDSHYGGTPSIFMFGSAGSFLKADDSVFEMINRLPFKSYINLGLEAFDGLTLNQLGKPITPEMVKKSLEKMIKVNQTYGNIEVSANFLLGTTFTDEHHEALIKLLSELPEGSGKKGCVYLSPLVESLHRDKVLPMFNKIKTQSKIPAYLYLIQRL